MINAVKTLLQALHQSLARRLNAWLGGWFAVKPLALAQGDIIRWFKAPLGQRILAWEQQQLNGIMPKVYGYHLMQLSVLNDQKLSLQSPVTHHFTLGINEASGQRAVARFEQLPIRPESVDGVILHHVLEYSPQPHQLLREAANTVIPNGYIVLVCFNPFSLLNLKKQLGRLFTRAPHWRYHGLRCGRLIDWLRVLDFEPVSIDYGYHGLPFNRGYHHGFDRFCRKLLPLWGGFYVITARKSVAPMTFIKKPWKSLPKLAHWAKGSVISRKDRINNL